MQDNKLFMLILGCTPEGRNIEQHDVFFGIGASLKDLLPGIRKFWKDAGSIHIDSWREVTTIDNYTISVVPKTIAENGNRLFFLNLGGYKHNDLEEYHYKLFAVAPDKGDAIRQAKKTAFYLHTGFKGAESHIDDKYGVDVDDVHEIADILDDETKEKFSILINRSEKTLAPDKLNIGYLKLDKI